VAGLRVCVPRGALFEGSLERLRAAGFDVSPLEDVGRKLIFRSPDDTLFITTRPTDVPTYVQAGAADVGIVGKDVLRERDPDVYEMADLRFGECRMVYATGADHDPTRDALDRLGSVRVATKYTRVARDYFERTGRQVELVKVNGSVELAPLVDLADGIVDLVATGTTLRENGLVAREEIFESSARLIANRVSHKVRAAEIDALAARLTGAP
jgi:ATP phosphoribosyltransferase